MCAYQNKQQPLALMPHMHVSKTLGLAALVVVVGLASVLVVVLCARSAKKLRANSKKLPEIKLKEVNSFLDDGGCLLVYAPWCGHCNNIKPVIAEASREAGVKAGQIDGSDEKNREVSESIGLRGFPTLVMRYGGNNKTLVGGQPKENLVNFMRECKSKQQ